MLAENSPDLESYSLEELYDVQSSIDSARFPHRAYRIKRLIEEKQKASPKSVEEEKTELLYAGFWKRFFAFWIDVIALLPVILIVIWGEQQFRLFQLYWLVPGALIGLWFHVYLVHRYGGTPGKLLLNIRITDLDGAHVSFGQAMLRYSVLFILSTMSTLALLPTYLGMTDAQYFSMDLVERSRYLQENSLGMLDIVNVAVNIWIWSEFIVMLTNKKRRALHDFMAGTVVIRKIAQNKTSDQSAG
ncbi:MAG: RDD family protein [Aestuariibacter sp.]